MWEAAFLAVMLYSTERQIDAAKDAQEFREQQAAEARKKSDIQHIRDVREQVRSQRANAAAIVNAGANSGTSTSSGALGGISGTQADLAGNIAFTNQMTELDNRIGQLGVSAAKAQTQGTIFGAYGQVAGAAFTGMGGWKTIFSGNQKATA